MTTTSAGLATAPYADLAAALRGDLIRPGDAGYDQARAAWSAFVAQNPLDARVPQILFQVGESFQLQEKFDDAIAAHGGSPQCE